MSVTSPIKHRPGKASLLVQVHAVPSSRQPLQQHPPAPRHRGISKGLVLLALAVAVSVVGIWKMESLHRLQGLTPLVAAPRQQQQEQQQQQQELAVSKLNPKRLLLATHSRLMWYYPDTQAVTVLHEGEVGPPLGVCMGCRTSSSGSGTGCLWSIWQQDAGTCMDSNIREQLGWVCAVQPPHRFAWQQQEGGRVHLSHCCHICGCTGVMHQRVAVGRGCWSLPAAAQV
jgi:hypothetical protein